MTQFSFSFQIRYILGKGILTFDFLITQNTQNISHTRVQLMSCKSTYITLSEKSMLESKSTINLLLDTCIILYSRKTYFSWFLLFWRGWTTLRELWLKYSVGSNSRILPMHILFDKIGVVMLRVRLAQRVELSKLILLNSWNGLMRSRLDEKTFPPRWNI